MDENHGSSDPASVITSSSVIQLSGLEGDKSSAKDADNAITTHDLSSQHTDEFATVTSSPAETGSEEDQEVAFRLRSRSYSQEYAFKMERYHSLYLVPY